MRIAVDAMGGDKAPLEIVKGSLQTLEADPGVEILLVGDASRIKAILDEHGGGTDRLHIHHAPDVINGNDNPLVALRRKPHASVAQVARLVQQGDADAMVSCGNTGATVACAIFKLKLLEGVRRAGIATFIPSMKGRATICDVGANIRCQPEHLFQYGVMASILTRLFLGVDAPSIGLLNIGEEEAKGTDLIRQTREIFAQADVNFLGNLEGQDVFLHAADVVVCEGFVGNAVLKVAEGLAMTMVKLIGEEYATQHDKSDQERQVIRKSLEWIRRRTDYEEYGGAPLLGVKGACIIAHGRSDGRAVANAVRAAKRLAELGIADHIIEELQRLASTKVS